tara:strand:+ start:1541 stop:1711 length:171 start_codon:yes stop_codon:yes gene_type:complete
MSYRRKQKDLERKQKKTNRIAKDLSSSEYRQRIIPNKRRYTKSKYAIGIRNIKDYY